MMTKRDDTELEDMSMDAESPAEALDEAVQKTQIEDEFDETIPDDAGKISRKKLALLKARHKLEDLFAEKKIHEALDYLAESAGKEKGDAKNTSGKR